MRDHVRALAAKGHAVRVIDFHQTPLADEVAGRDHDHAGLITEEWLIASTPVGEADYYVCGPRPFLRAAVEALSLAGVPSARIHYDFRSEERRGGNEGACTVIYMVSQLY